MKLDPFLSPYMKTNLKWIIDLNVRAESIKLLEENMGITLYDLRLGKVFLAKTTKVEVIRGKIDKLDFIKVRNFGVAHSTIKKMKRQPRE